MTTVLPPPSKRQKLEIAERAREQQEIGAIPEGLGSVRVQFFDQTTGKATGGAVSIPVVDATVRNLELLLNSLQGNVRVQASPSKDILKSARTHPKESHTALPTNENRRTNRTVQSWT